MTPPPADTPSGPGWPVGPKPPGAGWSNRKFLAALGLVLAFHVALIFLFGARKPIVPRPLGPIPHLRLADPANEFIALGNPTLFALPNPHDVVSAFWRRLPPRPPGEYTWTENPRYLPPPSADLGASFRAFVASRGPVELPLDFKPEPSVIEPSMADGNTMPRATTDQISGGLAGRPVRHAAALPLLPRNDVIAPTTVQALVDVSGRVVSAVVLKTSGDHDADQLAAQLAREFRFAPAPRMTFGDLQFNWHTVPLTTTNEPASFSPP
jgi:TonB family protein